MLEKHRISTRVVIVDKTTKEERHDAFRTACKTTGEFQSEFRYQPTG